MRSADVPAGRLGFAARARLLASKLSRRGREHLSPATANTRTSNPSEVNHPERFGAVRPQKRLSEGRHQRQRLVLRVITGCCRDFEAASSETAAVWIQRSDVCRGATIAAQRLQILDHERGKRQQQTLLATGNRLRLQPRAQTLTGLLTAA